MAGTSSEENPMAALDRRVRRRQHRNGDDAPSPDVLRRVTIGDVAREAGVSPSAVSKVVRGAYGVSPQMRERVTAAIDRLEYRPHKGARGMRGSSFTIGVMLGELTAPYHSEIAQGISAELQSSPFEEILVVGGVSAEQQQRRIESLVDRQVDGLILMVPAMSQSWLEDLASTVPTVVIARHGGAVHFDTVVDDDRGGAGLMVDYLVGLGHKRIVHTSHPAGGLTRPFVLAHTARCDGFVAAMERHGLGSDVVETAYSEPGGYQAGLETLNRPAPPSAIFAGADIAALGVLRAAEELGWRVPDDVTVTGYDNIYASTIGRISLTTVDQSGHLTGSKSAQLLLERIGGRAQAVHYVLAPRLVERSTSARPAHDAAAIT